MSVPSLDQLSQAIIRALPLSERQKNKSIHQIQALSTTHKAIGMAALLTPFAIATVGILPAPVAAVIAICTGASADRIYTHLPKQASSKNPPPPMLSAERIQKNYHQMDTLTKVTSIAALIITMGLAIALAMATKLGYLSIGVGASLAGIVSVISLADFSARFLKKPE